VSHYHGQVGGGFTAIIMNVEADFVICSIGDLKEEGTWEEKMVMLELVLCSIRSTAIS
jgi:hypothetical protein